MRKRAVLAATLALAPVPAAYGQRRDTRTQAAQYQAAQLSAAQTAANQARAAAPRIPMPSQVTFTQGRASGVPADAITAMQTDQANATIYYTGTLDPVLRAHEVGHLLDTQALTDGDRHYFQRMFFADVGPGDWTRGTGATQTGLSSPNERFADWYGNAAVGNDPSRSWFTAYATPPDPAKFRQFVKALQRLGARQHLRPYS